MIVGHCGCKDAYMPGTYQEPQMLIIYNILLDVGVMGNSTFTFMTHLKY